MHDDITDAIAQPELEIELDSPELALVDPEEEESLDQWSEPTDDEQSATEAKSKKQSHATHASTDEFDITNLYLNSLSRPLLTAEQEIELAYKVQGGDQKAHKTMVEANLRLVVNMSKRYMNKGMAFLDLISEGNLGLMRAVDKFDPELGYRFSTYATWWIKQSIERALLNQTRTIRVPIHVLKDLNSYLRAMSEMRRQLEREPSLTELSEYLGKPIDEVRKVLTATKNVDSIDEAYDDSRRPILETICQESDQNPEQEMVSNNFKGYINKWLDKLSLNQRTVITMRFGLRGHDISTLDSIGKQIGLTRERVRQIQIEAMNQLAQLAEQHDITPGLLFSESDNNYPQD